MIKTTIGAIALFIAAPLLGAQQQFGRDSDVWRWDGRVESGKWMTVFNVNGSVDFQPSSDNMVHLVAEKRTNHGEPDDIHYEVVQQGGNVTICAIWNNNARCEDGDVENFRHRGDTENHTSVKFTVSVPRSVKVGAHSVNGGVSVREVGQEVRANTVNGGVTVRNAAGPVRANTVNGGVDVRMVKSDILVRSVNGKLSVSTSGAAEASMTLETGKPDRLDNMHAFTAEALSFLLKTVSK